MSRVRPGAASFSVVVLAALLFAPVAGAEEMASRRPMTPDECINLAVGFFGFKVDFFVSLTGIITVLLETPDPEPGFSTAVFIVPEKCQEEGATLQAVIEEPPKDIDPDMTEPAHSLLP